MKNRKLPFNEKIRQVFNNEAAYYKYKENQRITME